MLESARAIIEFAHGKQRINLDTDQFLASAIERKFEILGEAASKISPQNKLRFPEIPWKEAIGMRNQLIHAYFDIDHDIVWNTIIEILPDLVPKIEIAIATLQTEEADRSVKDKGH